MIEVNIAVKWSQEQEDQKGRRDALRSLEAGGGFCNEVM